MGKHAEKMMRHAETDVKALIRRMKETGPSTRTSMLPSEERELRGIILLVAVAADEAGYQRGTEAGYRRAIAALAAGEETGSSRADPG